MSREFGGANEITDPIDPTAMRAYARVGTVLKGKWRLDVLLGVGGMAAVYASTHRNESRAAIKILHPELTLHPEIRSRFLREGRAANVVGHPGAVRVLDEDVDDQGSVFLVMELLDGESLEDRAKRKDGKLPVDELLAVADQLLDVLAAAHEKGIVHRDLKPENIFLTRDGVVKVLDFGIARLRQLSASTSRATREGTTLGTPSFMAPEQARGRWDEVDGRTDLWAVGATMYALLTARPVHEARTTNEVLLAAMTKPAALLRSIAPEVPSPVATLVDRALAFNKAERWPHARSMQQAVRGAYERIHSAPISTGPKLLVPAIVPNRTLPSAGVTPPVGAATAGSFQPVSNGITAASLVRTIARHRGIAAAALMAAGVLIAGVIAWSLVARGVSTVSTSATAPGSMAPAAAPPEDSRRARERVVPAPSQSAKVVTVEQLPTAAAPAERRSASQDKSATSSAVMTTKPAVQTPATTKPTPVTTSKPKARSGSLAEEPE